MNIHAAAIDTAAETVCETASPRRDMANAIRALAMDAVQKANSGHPGMPMGMADVATVLFNRFIKLDPVEAGLAGPRPLRAVGRPRLDAAIRAASSARLCRTCRSRNCSVSASSAAARPAIPNMATRSASRRPPGRSARALPTAVGMALAERMLAARFGAGPGRPLHLCHRRRRLPAGRHQPRGDRPCRPSEARSR